MRDKIQQQALDKWLEEGKAGTCEIITGLGKTFISLHALTTMPKDKVHLFLAETTSREEDLKRDIKKYSDIFGVDLSQWDLQFYCYQTAYKWKNKEFGLVIADK